MKVKRLGKNQFRQFVGAVVQHVMIDRWLDRCGASSAVGLNIQFLDGHMVNFWCAGNGDVGISKDWLCPQEKGVTGEIVAGLSGEVLKGVVFLDDGLILEFRDRRLTIRNDSDQLVIEMNVM